MQASLVVAAAIVGVLLGWGVNQLPTLKTHVPTSTRLLIVVGLTVISILVALGAAHLAGTNNDGRQTGSAPSSTVVASATGSAPSALPSEPTTTPTSDPSTSPSPNTGSSRVIFKDSFRLATGEGINLDAGKTKIQSGVSITDGDGMDLYVDGWADGNLKAAPTPQGQGRFFKSRSGTLDDCASLIERGQDSDTSAVPVTTSSLWYCFLTSEGRVAAVRIGGRSDGAVPINATVWDRIPPP
ncbi:hypothetical protein ACIA5C_47205 [Actinoplanes sp. NPDC051343]|uniref:hypothetical protein n=1 Tax=Actinoplanes sp. NPDC051343 TaxID=3363906 RepID=UPI0037B73580